MTTNFWRWTGALSNEWADNNGQLSNWTLVAGSASTPGSPSGTDDDARIDTDASISANTTPGGAQLLFVVNSATVTLTSGNFGFGKDGNDGLTVDEDATLIVAPGGVSVADTGSFDVVGLSGNGTLEVQGGSGFDDFAMLVGSFKGSSGEITVDAATFEVNKSGSGGEFDGQLIVGQAGDGSVSFTDNSLFFADTTIVGKSQDSNGDLTLDDSTWGGSNLMIGPAGNGTVTITNGATALISNVTIGPNGELDVTAAAGLTSSLTVPNLTLAFGTLTVSGGGEVDVAGGLVQGAVDVGTTMIGLGTINGNLVIQQGGIVEADQPLDGTLTVNGNISGAGIIEPIRTFEANGVIAAGITIAFAAPPPGTNAGVLQLDVPRGDDGTITGFAVGNTIDIEGLLYTDAVFTPGTGGNPGILTLSGGSDAPLQLKVDGDYAPNAFLATSGTTDTLVTLVPCYCPGTLIRMRHGDKAVEELEIGDEVMTLSGALRPIKWIGRRGYAGRFIAGRKDILPVCIKAGAIADMVPRRDLWISPHHAMYLEGILIEAKDLINNVSIVQADHVEEVEYFHIELDTHDVIIAEGAWSESYLDEDNRFMFHNVDDYHARYESEAAPVQYCAPRLEDGYEVEAARRRIDSRAGLRAKGEGLGTLRGYVDEVSASRIAGWAQAIDFPEAPVCLDIYAGERLIGQVLANLYREDLQEAGLGSGCHAFEFTVPAGMSCVPDVIEVRRSLDGALLDASSSARMAPISPSRRGRRSGDAAEGKMYRRAAHG
jgi:T5SS/PEP-CTERM-associated repeat protein